jgi:GH15 family glucan-1,4-alpha-glucosidase
MTTVWFSISSAFLGKPFRYPSVVAQTPAKSIGWRPARRFGPDPPNRRTLIIGSFQPHVLRNYALIADGERGAVIGPDGAISWLCAPRWDSPAVFSGLLGGRGTYAVTPADPWHVWGGYYEAGSLIWRSRWSGSSRKECREALGMLLPVIRGTLPADDPRIRATVCAVQDELTEDGYVYRFRHDARPLHKSEGAFLLCGFWMAQVAQVCGDAAAAARWFERNRAACGPAGLYTEEYDVHQRQLRGNLPQAFVHAGMLECAARLSASYSEPGPSVAVPG